MTQIDDLFIKRVHEWARQHPAINAILLFGSRAAGTSTEKSDWDVCCIVDSSEESWYATWHFNAEEWKQGFCLAANIPPESVQFCAPTSEPVVAGVLKRCQALYIRSLGAAAGA